MCSAGKGILEISVLSLLLGPSAFTADVTLESFAVMQKHYSLSMGGELPGAKADFKWTRNGYNSIGALRIDYDFTGGGRYCVWIYSGWLPPRPTMLRFYAKGSERAKVLVRLLDSTGQTHQYTLALKSSVWEPYEAPIKGAPSHGHYGGANDGQMHLPLKRVLIGPHTADGFEKGTLLIDEVVIRSEASLREISRAHGE